MRNTVDKNVFLEPIIKKNFRQNTVRTWKIFEGEIKYTALYS